MTRTAKPTTSPPGPIAIYKTPVKIGGRRLIGELSNKLLTIRLTATELRALRDFASSLGVTVAELVRSALITQLGVDVIRRARLVVYVPQPAAVDVEAVRHLKAIAGVLIGLLRAPELTQNDVARQRALIRDLRGLVDQITSAWQAQAAAAQPAVPPPQDVGTRNECARTEPATAAPAPPTSPRDLCTASLARAQETLATFSPAAAPLERTAVAASTLLHQGVLLRPGVQVAAATQAARHWQEKIGA